MGVGDWKRKAGAELSSKYMAAANDISGDEEVTIPDNWEGRMEMIAAGVWGVKKSQLIIQACAAIADSVQIANYLESLEYEQEARQIAAIYRLVDHLYDDQYEHFGMATLTGGDAPDHLFRAVRHVDDWLKATYRICPVWADYALSLYAKLRKDPDDANTKWELVEWCGRVADGGE